MTTQQVTRSKPATLQWGTLGFQGWTFPISLTSQIVPGLRVGPEVTREGREGIVSFRVDDLSGGMLNTASIMSWARDKNRVYFNEGLYHHIPGILTLPYKLTSQATLKALDVSGYRAANLRVHAITSSLGATGQRWYAFIGPNLYLATSLTDPTLIVPVTADNITENVTAVARLQLNSVNYLSYAAGTTDDLQGTADPTADSITWVKLVTLTGTPYINAMAAFPHLGPGVCIFIGNPAGTAGVYYGKFTDAVPLTLKPVVLRETKDTEGSLATTTTSAEAAGFGAQDFETGVGDMRWTNPENVAGSDDARAVWNMAAITDVSNYLIASGFDFTAVPIGALVTGISVGVECSNSSAAPGKYLGVVELLVNGAKVGLNRGNDTLMDQSTDATITYGGSTDRWGTQLTGADIQQLGVRLQAFVEAAGSAATDARVDNVTVTVTYRMPGVSPTPASGGYTCGVLPSNPSRLPVIEPERDDLTAITVPRRLKFYDFSWDTAGDRPLVDVSFPHTGLVYAGVMKPFQGGLAVAGGSNSTVWNIIKLIDANDQTRDLGFPAAHGANALTITGLESQGNVLLIDTAYTDGSEAQRWLYYNGRLYASFVQQDKSSAISTEPILWAESSLNTQQNFAYRFYPVSTTHIAGAREFVPPDLFSDPRLTNTSQVKQDGPLYAQLVELDVGPEEADKAIMALQMQSRQIDNNTAYGSARILIDTGGDRAISAAEVDETFNAASEILVDRNIVTTNDPGIAFKSQIIRIILDHEAASAETPNGLPFLELMTMQWPFLERFAIDLATYGQVLDPLSIFKACQTLKASKVAQRFRGGGYDCPAVLDDVQFAWAPTIGVQPPSWADVKGARMIFRRVIGSTA